MTDTDTRTRLLADAIERGEAYGNVLLPHSEGGSSGATTDEALEALCLVIDRLRASEARQRLAQCRRLQPSAMQVIVSADIVDALVA